MLETKLIGNLVKDPNTSTYDQTTFCNFVVAINNRRNNTVDFVKITALNSLATACYNYLQKGSQVYVSGRPKVEMWEDKEQKTNGILKVMANEVEFLNKIKPKQEVQ